MVGLDLTDPSIWASGIEAMADDLNEAEALATEIGLGLANIWRPLASRWWGGYGRPVTSPKECQCAGS